RRIYVLLGPQQHICERERELQVVSPLAVKTVRSHAPVKLLSFWEFLLDEMLVAFQCGSGRWKSFFIALFGGRSLHKIESQALHQFQDPLVRLQGTFAIDLV